MAPKAVSSPAAPKQGVLANRPRGYLFINEWRESVGMSAEQLADALGMARPSIYRWMGQQHRLNPQKMARLADIFQIEPPQLFRPPGRVSIDAILKDADPQEVQALADYVSKRVLKN